MNWDKVDQALEEAVLPYSETLTAEDKKREYVSPGAVLLVGRGSKVLYHKAFGCKSTDPEFSEMQKDTVFDLASLTKAIVTTTLIMQLVEQGRVELDHRLSIVFQTSGTYGKEKITLRQLLSHSSGYPAHIPVSYTHLTLPTSG